MFKIKIIFSKVITLLFLIKGDVHFQIASKSFFISDYLLSFLLLLASIGATVTLTSSSSISSSFYYCSSSFSLLMQYLRELLKTAKIKHTTIAMANTLGAGNELAVSSSIISGRVVLKDSIEDEKLLVRLISENGLVSVLI